MTIKLEVLNTALELLEAQDSDPKGSIYSGICQFLSTAGRLHEGGQTAAYYLKKLVSHRLGGFSYLHVWLHRRYWLSEAEYAALEFSNTAQGKALRAKLKATRIAWLKSLIKEHSK